LAGVDRETFWRLRRALKDDALGAAMILMSSFGESGMEEDGLVNGEVDTVVNVVLSWVHR
jgi:hypothetical protein